MVDVAVPAAAPLANLRRVELVHTGDWPISTGRWHASREDLAAAVAALDCPSVRRPVIKLGHSHGEQPLWSGNPTGAPAVGWVDNIHLTNQGHTLVGDLVGMPGWLADVAASAYPDRSVEGTYEHRCQLGHTHPFVLTAVALLGVTPPGVGTLRSLQDVGRLYGVRAAAGQQTDVTAHAQVHTGAMVALIPSDDDIARLAVDGGEPADQLHTTLLFLGQADQFDGDARQAVVDVVRELADVIPPGDADGFAVAAFNPHNPDMDTAIVVEVGGDGLEDVHGMVEAAVEEVAEAAGITLPDQHTPWRPHITLVYDDDLRRVVELADRSGPMRYDRLRVAFAGQHVDIPLSGESADLDVDALTDADMPQADEVEAARSQTRRITRSDAPLRRYWLRGKGAAKIRWNTPGDWTRCVRQLRRYVRDPKGLCAVYHKQATGMWTGDRRHRQMHAAFDPDQPRDDRGRWTDLMHPAAPDEITGFQERFGKSIPPAWSDVHIADDLDTASLLVVGRDGKGRRQSIYSTEHTEAQAAKKFARVQTLNDHLDKLDFALERDAATNDDAAALLLIRRLGMRPGSFRDTHAAKRAYGASTLQVRHVHINGGTARLSFVGKDGVQVQLSTADPQVVDMLSRRLAGRINPQGQLFQTTVEQVRDYMHSTGVPREFLLKDLRTLHANTVALREIEAREGLPGSKREFQSWRRQVATVVSQALGNTPTLALSSYINPTVFGAWAKDPAWVNAAAADEAAIPRAEEKRLLASWFAAVTFDRPETGIPAVEPDPDDDDDDGAVRQVAAHLPGRHVQRAHGNRYGPDGTPIPGRGVVPAVPGTPGGGTRPDGADKPKVKIPRREGPAKRGDILVAEHEPSSGTMSSETLYGVYEVVTVGRDGVPRRVRELAGPTFPGYEHDYLTEGRLFGSREQIIPANQVDTAGLKRSLQENAIPGTDVAQPYQSLDELGDVIRRHLVPDGQPNPTKSQPGSRTVNAGRSKMPNPNPTIVHAAAGISVDDVRTAFYAQAPQQVWIREFHQRPLRLIVANDADGTVARVDVRIGNDGTIAFGAPVPVQVEYVDVDADAGAVAASRMVYASRAESRPAAGPPPPPGFEPAEVAAHLSGRHNQMTHGNRYRNGKLVSGPGKGKSIGFDAAIRGVYDALTRGEGASIDPADLDGLLRTLTGGGDEAKRANLASLNVRGYGTLFATDKTDARDRSKMPQLGTNEEEMRPFLNVLRDRGVSVRIAEIDPTTLRPSQSEISGAKTGKLYGFMAKDGWLPGGLLVTSNDGYVVDGHHRWSGAAAVRASGTRPDMTVTGLVVDRPIDEVLELAASVARFESLEFDRDAPQAAAAAAKVSNRPWSGFTEADYTVEQLRRAALIVVGDGTTKEDMKLPVREPDGTLNRNGVHAAAARINQVKGVPGGKLRAAARVLVRLYAQIGDEPPENLREMAGATVSAHRNLFDPYQTPAAEPGNPTIEEDDMSLSTEVRQRLGLADDADDTQILAALDELVGQVNQSVQAAAENQDLATQVKLLEEQVQQLSAQIAAANAEKAAQVKASVLEQALKDGKFDPADRAKWEASYDKAPDVVAQVLASIAVGTAVPVTVHGSVGEPADVTDGELPPEPEGLFPPDTQAVLAGKEN